jgi:uracil-DNA glycosylase
MAMTDPRISDSQRAAFRERASTLDGIDMPVYESFGKDALEPIIGLGDPDLRIGFFGRDPGREEVRHGMPFIGNGGQKVRAAAYRHLYGAEMPDFDASVAVGRLFFWANTVPYKPMGNKAWPMRVKRPFQPLMAELLLCNWRGADLITLGREAFLWFGINQSREVRDGLDAFWAREDRFTATHELPLALDDGRSRTFRLHPLPHPSPLNATWYKRFPELLTRRLVQLDARPDNLRLQ